MIGYPVAAMILLSQNISIFALIITIVVPILLNLQLIINRRELSIISASWKISKLIYIFSIFAASIIIIPNFNLVVYAVNLLSLIYLSKIGVLDDMESHILPIFSTIFIFVLEYYTFGVSPLIIFLAVYLNTILFYKTDWIRYSRTIVQFLFPYQITYGYYSIFSTVPYIDIIILATIAALAIIVPLCKTGIIISLNHVAALTILGYSQGNPIILSGLLLVYILAYSISSIRIHPIILLSLLVPTSIFIHNGQAYPILLALLGIFYLVIGTFYEYMLDEGKIKQPNYYILFDIFLLPVVIYVISYALFALTIMMYKLDLFTWSAGYLVSLFVLSFLIDFAEDIETLSHYTLFSSASIIFLIIYKYGVLIETTVLTSIVAIATILFGTLTDRSYTRKFGIFTMLITSIKGVADIFFYITISNLSIFLKIALGFLTLGIVLIATSYLYLKIYTVRKKTN